tara:strand:- start:1004 stop:1936 length:933 start_codon:yes stop_codon:yes gene_type:complete
MSFTKKFRKKNPITQLSIGEEKVKNLRQNLKDNYTMPLTPSDNYPDVEITDEMLTPYQKQLIEWNQARYNTGRYDDQLGDGNLERQKINLASAKTIQDKEEAEKINRNIEWPTAGQYFPETHTMFSGGLGLIDRLAARIDGGGIGTTKKHETAHAANARPQDDKITEITGHAQPRFMNDKTGEMIDDKGNIVKDPGYLKRADEVYARLTAFRLDNNIDPNRIWTEQDLPELKNMIRPSVDKFKEIGEKNNYEQLKSQGYSDDEIFGVYGGKYKFWGELDDKDLLRLMNEVAVNSPKETWQEEMQRKNNIT